MRQDFVLDYGGVSLDVNSFDGERGDLGKEDTAEGIGDRGIDVDEVEFGEEGGVAVEFDTEGLGGGVSGVWFGRGGGRGEGDKRRGKQYAFELANVPGVIFVRPVAGEISRGDICDDFGLNSDDL